MKKLTIILIFILFLHPLRAQLLEAHRSEVKDAYNFWFYTPPADTTTLQPLIVFMHGQSLCGNNMDRVRRYGPLNALEMGMQIPAMVLAPQNPGGSWNPDKVMRLVDWAVAHYPIDTNRIYALGMSLGGFGTLDLAGTYPHRIAAAMALCGGSTLRNYCGLNELPLWIMHGTADRAVGIAASQRVVDAMEACDTSHRLIWSPIKGANHGRLARVFYLPETYQWLLAHNLQDSARVVDRSVEITAEDMGKGKDIYRQVRAMGNRITVRKASTQSSMPLAEADTTAISVPDDSTLTSSDPAPKATAKTGKKYHTIRRGDTLFSLARHYGTTVSNLCQLNHISENSILRTGRRLRVR